MNFQLWIITMLVSVFFGVMPPAAQAQGPLALEDLIAEALENNRELQAAREDWEAARHRVPQASALPDPTVGYTFMGPMMETPLGPQEEMYEFEQMIPFPGKLVEKRKMASAEVREEEARRKMIERDVIFKVSEAYYELFTVQASLQAAEEVHDLLVKFEAIAQSRYASQASSLREVAKAQAEVSEILQRIFVLRQQKDSLQALLTALLGRTQPLVLDGIPEPSVPSENISVDELLQTARQNRPELLMATARRERQGHAQSLARYEYAPDMTVGFRYTQIGDGTTTDPDDGRDSWMVPVTFTIPLWQNRIVPAVAEARSQLRSSQARLEQAEQFTEYEVRRAYYQFLQQKQTVELYRNAFLPQAELAFRSDRAGYEAGNIDIRDLIDSERIYLNARMAYYEALGQALASWAGIEWTVGSNLRGQGGEQ